MWHDADLSPNTNARWLPVQGRWHNADISFNAITTCSGKVVQCGPLTQCHYLFGEGGLLQLNVCFGVGQDGLQRLAQELLVKVLVLPHQRTEGHSHLHLHASKVLEGKKMTEVSENLATGPMGSQLNVHQLAFCSVGSRYDLGLPPYLFSLSGSEWQSRLNVQSLGQGWKAHGINTYKLLATQVKKKVLQKKARSLLYKLFPVTSQHLDSEVCICGILSNVMSCQRTSIKHLQLMWAWSAQYKTIGSTKVYRIKRTMKPH